MSDYRLDNLHPRLFERIVQELAIGAISSTVTPFGDGPDGGREATFEGLTSYGPSTSPWSGSGIIQAKYKIRPGTTAQYGAWAVSQLRDELSKYGTTKDKREPPQYYIFATNAILAPNAGGSKDRVIQLLENFVRKFRLRGFDVWDYDKLQNMITRDEKVRRAYLAWISPSDVLADMCDFIKANQKDYYKIILRYLQRGLLADQYAQLEQAGHSNDEAIPLSQVFIDPPISTTPVSMEVPRPHYEADQPRLVSLLIGAAGDLLKTDSSIYANADPELGEYKARRLGRYVLIGGPGQGKTTVSQYICQIFRCEILQDVPERLLSAEVASALAKFTSQWDPQLRPSARRLPFRVVLSDFAKSLADGSSASLLEYLALKLCARTGDTLAASDVERIIREYPAIVVLDGLDEVPPSTNRDEVLEAVTSFSIDVSSGDLDVLMLATTRPQGYNDEFSPRQYHHYYLEPLAPSDAMTYGRKLAQIRFGSNEDRFLRVIERLEKAMDRSTTVRLMRTPLQVTILTLLVDRMGDPPDERWSLFKDYYQLIYDRETERDIPSAAVLKSNRAEVDVIHHRVGIALQVESEKSGRTDARLTVSQFGSLVEDYLTEEGHEEPGRSSLKQQIIEAAANRLVFLVGLEYGQVGFEIRSLQEYMAAEGLTDGEDAYVYDRLRSIAASPHWRNVYLFAAGKCFTERRYMRPVIEAICNELNDDPDDASLRYLLVGSELALDLLEDGPARRAPRTRGGMTRIALKLLDKSPEWSERLSGICENETRYIFIEVLRDYIMAQASNVSCNAWRCLTHLVDRIGEEFEQLAREMLAHKPWAREEFTAVMATFFGGNAWLGEELIAYVERTAPPVLRAPFAARTLDRYSVPWIPESDEHWLRWYLRIVRPPYRARPLHFRVAESSSAAWLVSHNPLLGSEKNPLIPPNNAPTGDVWAALHSLGDFCVAPSRASLLSILRNIQASDVFGNRVDRWSNRCPWVLNEALQMARSHDTAAVSDVVESESYGDIVNWLDREHRWGEGIELSELLSLEPLLMTPASSIYVFPFETCRQLSLTAVPCLSP